jgi:hypothetical protein
LGAWPSARRSWSVMMLRKYLRSMSAVRAACEMLALLRRSLSDAQLRALAQDDVTLTGRGPVSRRSC